MQPRQLKTFLSVAQTLNFSRAAEMVHLAQSSVSDQIQALEADLGVLLFKRTKQGISLTPSGVALQSYASELLALADEARNAVRIADGKAKSKLTIGTLETIAAVRLAGWLSDFQKKHPDIGLNVKVGGSGELHENLDRSEIDVAITFARATADTRVARRALGQEPMVLIARPGSAPSSFHPYDLTDVSNQKLIVTQPGCIYRHMLDEVLQTRGIAIPMAVLEVDSIGTIIRLVSEGVGISLVPRLAAKEAIAKGEVVEVDHLQPLPEAPLQMIWRQRRTQPAALKALLAFQATGAMSFRPDDGRLRHAALCPL